MHFLDIDWISELIAADLTPSTERVALRLLARTSNDGHLCLSWDDYCQLCNRTNCNSARRHLTLLVKAGLIRYHAAAGTGITISWLALIDPGFSRHEQRAHAPQAAHRRATGCGLPDATDGARASPAARGRAVDGVPARQSSHTRAVGGGGTRSYIPEKDYTTTTKHSDAINRKLREIGLRPKTVRIDASLTDGEIERIVDEWLLDVDDDTVGVGALIYRLINGITPPDLEKLEETIRYNKYIPEEYRDIIIGGAAETPP